MKSGSAGSDSQPVASEASRRSHRVMLRLSITVTGVSARGPFSEETHTLVINAHGALISVAAGLSLNQVLEIRSAGNAQSRPCRVVFVGPVIEGRTQSGIEFTEPAPRFWPVAFPPDDWSRV